jgi:IPT/TIG domain-containing protein
MATSVYERSQPWRIGAVIAAIIIVAYVGSLPTVRVGSVFAFVPQRWWPGSLFWAYMSVLLYLSIACIVTRSVNPLQAVVGADGRLSTSKFQFFLWTGIALFTFVWIICERGQGGPAQLALPDLPRNLMIAMGFSITTVAGAKGITVSYVNSGRVAKPEATPSEQGKLSGLVATDDGRPDLLKIQMLVWTVIGAIIYLARVFGHVSEYAICKPTTTSQCFPDIDEVLMVLMGLGQGAYLGGKLVSGSTAAIASITPNPVLPGQDVSLIGAAFGASPGRAVLGFGAAQSVIVPKSWSDSTIIFTVPSEAAGAARWRGGEQVEVVLMIDGARTAGESMVTIALPNIGSVGVDPKDQRVSIVGGPFGPQISSSFVTIGTQQIPATDPRIKSWTNTRIEILKPGPTGVGLPVTVTANTYTGGAALATI